MLNRYLDVFSSLSKLNVRYLVIGGIAVVLHGVPRATFDLDILVESTPDNAQRLLEAFLDAGLGTAALTTPEELLAHEITIFQDKVRIDVKTKTPGMEFESAWKNKEVMRYQGQDFFVAGKRDLLASMKASGRDVDQEDFRLLSPDAEDPTTQL